MTTIRNRTVLITGGNGFLGKHVVERVKLHHPKKIIVPRSHDCDLREKRNCESIVKGVDIVIHLAGNVGGIGYNQSYPANLFEDNILMGVHLMKAAREARVKKFVTIGTICSYPKHTNVPFKESDLWNGYPEETNAAYGLAKKALLVQGQAYRQQYDFNTIYLLLVNLYGPGDNFNPQSSHVIPALIHKFATAKKENRENVVVWGTGKATREFIFVEDAARGIVQATMKYNKPNPINIGAGFEISIKELAEIIKKQVGYEGKITWDITKPDGQPRRSLDTTNALKEFDFSAETKFKEGLDKTVKWYFSNSPY